MKSIKKHLSIIVIAAMLLTIFGAIPKTSSVDSPIGAETSYAATKDKLTTIYGVSFSNRKERASARGIKNTFFLNKNSKLCISTGQKGKATVIGSARGLLYLATDDKKVYFTDVAYNKNKNRYTSKIFSYDIKTKRLKTLKTLRNRFIDGIFVENKKMFCYSGENEYSSVDVLKIQKNGKVKTLIEGMYLLEQGISKGAYRIILQETITGATDDKTYFNAVELNCKTEKKRILISGSDFVYKLCNENGESLMWAKGTSEEVILKFFSWNTAKTRTIANYEAKGRTMAFQYIPSEGIIYGMEAKETAKKETEHSENGINQDITLFTVNQTTGIRKDFSNYEDVAYPYLSIAIVNMSEDPTGVDNRLFAALQFNKHDKEGTPATYIIKGGKAYYFGQTPEDKKAFEKEFGGCDPVIY